MARALIAPCSSTGTPSAESSLDTSDSFSRSRSSSSVELKGVDPNLQELIQRSLTLVKDFSGEDYSHRDGTEDTLDSPGAAADSEWELPQAHRGFAQEGSSSSCSPSDLFISPPEAGASRLMRERDQEVVEPALDDACEDDAIEDEADEDEAEEQEVDTDEDENEAADTDEDEADEAAAPKAIPKPQPYACTKRGCDMRYGTKSGLRYHELHGTCNTARTSKSKDLIRPPTAHICAQAALRVRLYPYVCALESCGRRYKRLTGLRKHQSENSSHVDVAPAVLKREARKAESGSRMASATSDHASSARLRDLRASRRRGWAGK